MSQEIYTLLVKINVPLDVVAIKQENTSIYALRVLIKEFQLSTCSRPPVLSKIVGNERWCQMKK